MVAEFFRETHKKRIAYAILRALSGKQDSNSRFACVVSRELYLHPPTPERGALGSLGQAIVADNTKRKKTAVSCLLRFVSGKRESVHLLPTLYIKQLPLPSTILPIRGTLG